MSSLADKQQLQLVVRLVVFPLQRHLLEFTLIEVEVMLKKYLLTQSQVIFPFFVVQEQSAFSVIGQ